MKIDNRCNTTEAAEVTPQLLIDRLRIKRAHLAKVNHAVLRKLDRQIELLEASDAENIVRSAEAVLFDD